MLENRKPIGARVPGPMLEELEQVRQRWSRDAGHRISLRTVVESALAVFLRHEVHGRMSSREPRGIRAGKERRTS